MKFIKRLIATAAIAAATVSGAAHAQQQWPTRPVTLVVSFSAGGPVDSIMRGLAEQLTTKLGQPVIVENKPGGGTMIATRLVAKSAPDGYTFLVAASSHGINPAIRKNAGYDPVTDFTPVTLVSALPHLLMVPSNFPANNVAEFIEVIRKSPDKFSYASSGVGVSNHLEGELFLQMAGVKMAHVPYKGTAPAMLDLAEGRVHMLFDVIGSSMKMAATGKVKPLGVVLGQRSTLLPDIPTIAESGLPGFAAMPWIGIVGPAGLDSAIVAKLNAALQEVLALPATKERLAGYGAEIMAYPPDRFAAFIKADREQWARIAREAKIHLED